MQKTSQYQRKSESLLEAAGYADEVLDDIREWARSASNYDGSWSAWDGVTKTSATFPGISARVDVQTTGLTPLWSPDTEAERLWVDAGNIARVMTRGYVQVRVQAGRDLASPVGRVDVHTQIAPPSPEDKSTFQVSISGTSSLSPGGNGSYTATAFADGRLLPSATFEWHLHNDDGEASETGASRDGRTFGIVFDGTRWDDTLSMDVPATGPIEVEAIARINGTLVHGYYGVNLTP